MKTHFLAILSLVLITSCGGNNGGGVSDTVSTSTKYDNVIQRYEALKKKKDKSSKESFEMQGLSLTYKKGKALGKRGIKFSKGDNIFPQNIVTNEPFELFIVDQNGEEKDIQAWFKSDAPEISIIQSMDGNYATITASELEHTK